MAIKGHNADCEVDDAFVPSPDKLIDPLTRFGSVLHYFFFQAEDGIRDVAVTGVQTCALPIYKSNLSRRLKTMQRYGFVQLSRGARGAVISKVPYQKISLTLPLSKPGRQGIEAAAHESEPGRLAWRSAAV